MQSPDRSTDRQDASAGDAPPRSQSSQRWGRGSATALDRMKELEKRHNPGREQGERNTQGRSADR